ncbi:MAG: ABC transporter permease [Methylobacteriaceae bacterium]|nr:ABC transporter permease [Methylobacteriaceae bacterium]
MSSAAEVPAPARFRFEDSSLAIKLRQNVGLVTAIALFCVIYLLYHVAHPKGFSSAVLVQNGDEIFTLAMVAMAQTVPVLAAGLDLSVGALMTMVGCFASYLLSGAPEGTPINLDLGGLHLVLATLPGGTTGLIVGMILCLVIGTLAGLLNGCVVVFGRIQPIIATLATGAIYIGIALFLRPQPGGKIDDDLNWAMTNSLGDFASTVHIFNDGAAPWFAPLAWIPVPFILIILIAALVWVPFRRSVTGRAVYAVGSAEGAAYMSGLPIERAKIAAFTLGGFFAGCGGLFLAIQTSSGNADLPQAGAYTLNSIASVVIGGTSLLGGSGGAIGSIFGAMILRVISFFFRIFDIAPLLQPLFEGIILLAAVSIGALRMLRVRNTLELFR